MIQDYTPIMWDDKVFSFVPFEASNGMPKFSKDECMQVCNELNQITRLCTYKPKAGDNYYHPVTYVRNQGGFIVMDNQAAFDECPYPACADQENCQKICDMMNRVLENHIAQ